MLKMGESKPWPEALVKITGTRDMSAQPLLDYFQPLITWLERENRENNEQLGWAEAWTPKGKGPGTSEHPRQHLGTRLLWKGGHARPSGTRIATVKRRTQRFEDL